MKKFIFAIFACILLSGSTFAQDLENGIWQCQNPNNPSNSEMLIFIKGKVTAGSINLVTGEKSEVKGSFMVTGGNSLVIFVGNEKFVFTLKWFNKNKFALINSQGGYLYYGQVTTAEDQFMVNYMNRQNSGGYNSGTYNAPQKQQTCYTCYGTGRCNVCKGTKITSYYGYTNPCSACNQTGKCWHCNGSGIQ